MDLILLFHACLIGLLACHRSVLCNDGIKARTPIRCDDSGVISLTSAKSRGISHRLEYLGDNPQAAALRRDLSDLFIFFVQLLSNVDVGRRCLCGAVSDYTYHHEQPWRTHSIRDHCQAIANLTSVTAHKHAQTQSIDINHKAYRMRTVRDEY